MRFFDYVRFGLKNILRQKARTILTIFAIMIGATSVVALLSLVFGAKAIIVKQITDSGALQQITITSSTDTSGQDVFSTGRGGSDPTAKKLDDALVTTIKGTPHVTEVVPVVSAWALQSFTLVGGDGKQHSLDQVLAFDPGSALSKPVSAGRQLNASDSEGVMVLGPEAAAKLGYKGKEGQLVGQTLDFVTQGGYSGVGAVIPTPNFGPGNGGDNGNNDPSKQAGTHILAKIVGIAQSGGYDGAGIITMKWGRGLNESQRYDMDQSAMQAFNQANDSWQRNGHKGPAPAQPLPQLIVQDMVAENGYQILVAKVDSDQDVQAAADQISKLGVGVITEKATLDSINQIITIASLVLGAIGAIALLVAAIGVVNTMVMATLERTREIGVMRACGATRATVRRLFTFEAALLGFWGGVFGVLAALGITRIVNVVANNMLASQHLGAQNIVATPLWLIGGVIAATTVIGVLSGLYPAIRAARLNPVEALRYE